MTSRIHAAFAVLWAVAWTMAMPAAWAGHFTLNDTGMTECAYPKAVWSMDCAKSDQDAAYGRDVLDPNPDDGEGGFNFRKVCRSGQMPGEGSCPADPPLGSGADDWGCVYDNVSQLTWEAKTADGGIHDYQHHFSNEGDKARDQPTDAAWLVDATNAEALCGATNWRLPEVLELQSIVDFGRAVPGKGGPLTDPTFFPNTYYWITWTGTQLFYDRRSAWYVNFTLGYTSVQKRRFHKDASARLVHDARTASTLSQTALAKERFVPSADGTEVTDTMTGLIWRRCPEGMSWNNSAHTCDGQATAFYWKDALRHARANRSGGWRLPNVKELFSIVDHKSAQPSIDPTAFPNTPNRSFLTSTAMAWTPDLVYAHLVVFDIGRVEEQDTGQNGSWPLRLVRRGRE